MTPEQRYLLDINGYIVVERALDKSCVSCLLEQWDEKTRGKKLTDVSFNWGDCWRSLIDNHQVLEVVSECLSGHIRLDHAFCVTEQFGNKEGKMHHQSGTFEKGLYYYVQRAKIHAGLIGVIYSLLETHVPEKGVGGFCCIPGSHKANFEIPAELFMINDNRSLKRVPQKPGDAIIFIESLTHGTYLSDGRFPRRSIMVKYTPGYAAFREPYSRIPITRLAPTPGYPHDEGDGGVDESMLSELQRRIVTDGVFARGKLYL